MKHFYPKSNSFLQMKSKRGVFSEIDFLGAPFDKNGLFWVYKLLKTLSESCMVWNNLY